MTHRSIGSTLRALGIILLICAVSPLGLSVLETQAMSSNDSNGCSAAYNEVPYFRDGNTKWTYFKDVVKEMKTNADGKIQLGFAKASKRVEFPDNPSADFLHAAQASLDSGNPVHIAIDNAGGSPVPTPHHHPKALDVVQWVDLNEQHPSCN